MCTIAMLLLVNCNDIYPKAKRKEPVRFLSVGLDVRSHVVVSAFHSTCTAERLLRSALHASFTLVAEVIGGVAIFCRKCWQQSEGGCAVAAMSLDVARSGCRGLFEKNFPYRGLHSTGNYVLDGASPRHPGGVPSAIATCQRADKNGIDAGGWTTTR